MSNGGTPATQKSTIIVGPVTAWRRHERLVLHLMSKMKHSRGVTLIEAMIYVAISAALIAVAMAGVTYATRNNQRQAVQASQ